jgi:hypothetical protein
MEADGLLEDDSHLASVQYRPDIYPPETSRFTGAQGILLLASRSNENEVADFHIVLAEEGMAELR